MSDLVGILKNTLSHPVNLSYQGEGLVVPPRGQVKNVRKVLLGALPKGVLFIPDKNKK